jgi:hypothetical protein
MAIFVYFYILLRFLVIFNLYILLESSLLKMVHFGIQLLNKVANIINWLLSLTGFDESLDVGNLLLCSDSAGQSSKRKLPSDSESDIGYKRRKTLDDSRYSHGVVED